MPYTPTNILTSPTTLYVTGVDPAAATGDNTVVWHNLGPVTNVTYTNAATATPTNAYYPITWPNDNGQGLYGQGYHQALINQQIYYNVYNFQVQGIGTYTPCTPIYGEYVVNETQEQQAARIATYEAEDKKRKAAESKAEELLLMCLNDVQKEIYLKHGYLEINTDKAKYRIKRGWAKNIEKIGLDGKPELAYCIHPRDSSVPVPDNMLAQKLMIEYNEQEFLRLANRWAV